MDSDNSRSTRWLALRLLAPVVALWSAGTGALRGEAVDTELLLLVDVTKSVSDGEFDVMMEGYARAFESASVLDSIQSGDLGQIAASLVFFSGSKYQEVGVNWMSISDAASAEAFANALRTAVRPFEKTRMGIAGALDYATPLFGDETGGRRNGFESAIQMITMSVDGVDNNTQFKGATREQRVQEGRDRALAAGVDVINALTVSPLGPLIDAYYADFVIGGSMNGEPAIVQNTPDFANFAPAVEGLIETELTAVVPEPEVVCLLAGFLLLAARRRRPPEID